jgi:colanic acid biosynthesis glycosyl transferase WcaI
MHSITVWGINYYPELVGIGVYNTDLCQFLSRAGYDVTMVTAFPYYPQWSLSDSDRRCLYRLDIDEPVEGIPPKVQRCCLYVPNQPTVFRRILHEASFAISSFFKLAVLPRSDIYFVVMPPLMLGVLAWPLAWIKKSSIFLHVQDLQPDAAISLGMLKKGLFIRFLLFLEKLAYDKASIVSSISPELCRIIQGKGVAADKVKLLPNWVNSYGQSCLPKPGVWKIKHEIDADSAIISYAGNLGRKQGLELIIEVAKILQNEPRFVFVIAGNGGNESGLKKLTDDYFLKNVIFENVLAEEDHLALIQDSSICLIPQRQGGSTPFLPSKLLKILALGRAVVTNAEPDSALYNAVQQGKFGEAVAPGDAFAMARTILKLLHDPDLRESYGRSGQSYVKRFDKADVLNSLCALLETMAT